MTEQELARALMHKGLINSQQVQQVVRDRAPGTSFAQAAVDMGLVSAMDVVQVDAHAFDAAPRQRLIPSGAPAARPSVPQLPDDYDPAQGQEVEVVYQAVASEVGLGQDGGAYMDNSGVTIEGEEDRENDPVMGPIVNYCNELLIIAVQVGASDLHLEPNAGGLLPRYRVDGHLRPGDLIPGELKPLVTSRLKVLANLDITEQRLPQDGRFRATIGGRTIDFRVSSLPSVHGEKLVLRLLDRGSLVTDLTRLGFSVEGTTMFEEMCRRSYGLVLITGPTGSGKTTSLYAALCSTRDESKNVITVEDPVEYEVGGVTQTQVHAEIGLTFANQLRAILRQDPDVILVGEIRDNETADIAVRAALTGHLVLSTLHTNSAVTAVTRLRDMDVPPFLIASSLTGVLAQRLVRMICRNCRQPLEPESGLYQESLVQLRLPAGTPLFRGAGCEACSGTGKKGRMALVEILNVNAEFRKAIMNKAELDTLREIAVKSGMRSLWQDAMDKLKLGLTSPDEVIRVLLGAEDTGEDEL